MAQAKKKSTKKQPIKVQLSKQDLVELLTVLKNFTKEELQEEFRVLHHRVGKLHERIIGLEGRERWRESRTPPPLVIPLVDVCTHNERLESISYSERTGAFLAANYKCTWCGQENRKMGCFLSRKEKRALKKLGVKVR